MKKGYSDSLADGVLWENTGLKPIYGREAAIARLNLSIETWGEYIVESDCKNTLGVDEIVVVERVDRMIDIEGDLFCTVPIMGIFEICPEDNRIIRWSDYYDLKPMFKAMDTLTYFKPHHKVRLTLPRRTVVDSDLEEMLDYYKVRKVLQRHARGTDRVDPDLLESTYLPGAIDDHGVFRGTAEEFIPFAIEQQKAEIATQHLLGQTDVEFRGNEAFSETYFHASHFREMDGEHKLYRFCGRYIDRLEKHNGEWLIANRKVLMDWVDLSDVGSVGVSIDDFSRSKKSHEDESYIGR